MSKKPAVIGICLIVTTQFACNTGDLNLIGPTNVPPPTPALNFSPEIAVSPTTVTARGSSDPAFEWEVAFEVSLRDVARRGIRVDVARIEVRDPSGALVFEGSFRDLVSDFDGNVPVGATARWALRGIRYDLPGGGREATGNARLEMETGVGDFRTMNFSFPIS